MGGDRFNSHRAPLILLARGLLHIEAVARLVVKEVLSACSRAAVVDREVDAPLHDGQPVACVRAAVVVHRHALERAVVILNPLRDQALDRLMHPAGGVPIQLVVPNVPQVEAQQNVGRGALAARAASRRGHD